MKEMQENATRVSLEAARNKALTFKLKETLKPVQQTPSEDCSHQSEDLPQMERVEQKKPTFRVRVKIQRTVCRLQAHA